MAKSLTKSSASLVAAGGNLAEAAALTATANAIIQDADSVGTALKTTSLRLRGTSVKVLEEEGLDSDGAVESTSKLRSQVLATSGVDILTDTGAYKSTYQILLEIAEVWDQITDDKARAGLLELLAGKRNSSVIAALLQNPEDLKAAYKDAMNAEGSALKENEKYLDSIQGKIDQFNNAMQAMWRNTLDSDMVKGFVSLGAEIIKVIDKIGLLNTALIALAAISMIKNKMGPIAFLGGISDLIRSVVGRVGGFIGSLTGMTAATSAYTAETLAASVANGTLSASEAASIATKNGLTLATTNLTAAEATRMLTASGVAQADALAMVAQLGLTSSTQALTVADIEAAVSLGMLTEAQGAQATAALFGAGANKTLAASLGALWTALWPILAVAAGVAAIYGIVKLVDHLVVTTEELTEELNELKTELSDLESEIDGVNSELKTTEDRIAELLAKDSLTFTEEEELERLQKENAELQRKLDLLEQEEQFKQKEAAQKFNETMKSSNSDDYYVTGQKKEWWNYIIDGMAEAITPGSSGATTSLRNVLDSKIRAYENYATQLADIEIKMANTDNKDEYDKLAKEKTRIDEEMREIQTYIGDKTKEMNDNAEGLEYFTGDNLEDWQIEANKNLDKIKNFEDRWAIAQGGTNAKTNAINRIFSKDEYDEASDTIDDLVKQLAEDPTDQTVLDKISEQCKLAEKDLLAVGLSVEEAVGYFTKLGQEANFATLEGKIKEVGKAATNFESLIKGGSFKVDGVDTGLADLFDEEGKIIQTKLSQVFQGTSEQTREDITRLLEGSYDQIKNGTVDVERLLSGFALKTTQQVLEIQNKVLGEQNLELFPNLKDEIDGIIDKFSEFSTAVGSVVDALDTLEQARAEEAYSGSISIETLENLMKYTDDYTQLVEIDETGAIKLAADAEQILIEQRLQKIKTDAAAAVQTAQANLEQAKYNAKAVNETGPVQAALTSATDALAGSWAYLGSIIGDITAGNFSGIFERASAAYSNVTAGREEKRAQVNVSVEDAEEALAKALDQQKIANALTSENVKSKYSSDDASGGNGTEDEVKDERFQKEMDYWENRIGANQAKYEQIQHEIDMLESQGRKAGAKYYQEQINLENQRLDLLTQQKTAARTYLDQLTAAGKEGSEEWWEVANTINDIEGELDDVTASIVDLNDAMADTHWYMFDEAHDRVSTLTSDLENIRDILSNEELFDDEGNFTKEGLGTLASYVQELGIYEGALANARAEMELFGDAYDPNKTYVDAYGNDLSIDSEQDWYEAAEKAEEKYDEWNQKVIETKYNIKDLYEQQIDAVEEYTSTLVENYQDYIDATKEALDAERDLYEFKKSTEQKSKNIASIERRITSLSGSTNAADIAERRKLQAELTDAKSDMDDHYYSRSKDQQSQALDDEATAYEAAMNAFIEGLYTKLEESTTGLYMSYEEMSTETKSFVDGVTESVVLNAGNVKDTYLATGETIDQSLVTPWTNAAAAIGTFASSEGALGLMNSWTESKAGAPFYDFQTKVSGYLSKPWSAIIAEGGPVKTFKTSVNSIMSQIVSDVQSNVSGISGVVSNLQTEIDKIKDTTIRITTVYETQGDLENYNGGGGNGGGGGDKNPPEKDKTMRADGQLYARTVVPTNLTSTHKTVGGVTYVPIPGTDYYVKKSDAPFGSAPYGTKRYKYYAKGTTGITEDQLAIVDEFGPELMLRANPTTGRLDYVTRGTGIIPADATSELMKLADIGVDGLMMPKFDSGVNMMTNYITKPEFKIDIEEFVHVDRVDQNTLPQLEKMMDKKIDDFSRALNYSLKKFAR